MSSYTVKPRQILQAQILGVKVKASTRKLKKLDVFNKFGERIASIGASGYMDYASYILKDGLKIANKKRDAYLKRHAKEPKMKSGIRTNSYYADRILWG